MLACSGATLLGVSQPSQGREEVEEHVLPTIVMSPPRDPVLVVGERLSFHGRWFGLPVGRGWIEVKGIETLEGRHVYHIEAQGHSNDFLSTFYPIHDVLHSYLEVESLRPVRFEKFQREGRYRAEEIVTFDYDRLTATYRSLLNQSVKEVPIPPDVQDILSAFYWLRRQPFEPLQPLSVNIYSDEKIYRTDIKPVKTLSLELLWRGTFPCVMLEPMPAFKGVLVRRGRMWVYLSAAPSRIPLFLKISTPWGQMTAVVDPESLPPSTDHLHAAGHSASP